MHNKRTVLRLSVACTENVVFVKNFSSKVLITEKNSKKGENGSIQLILIFMSYE